MYDDIVKKKSKILWNHSERDRHRVTSTHTAVMWSDGPTSLYYILCDKRTNCVSSFPSSSYTIRNSKDSHRELADHNILV